MVKAELTMTIQLVKNGKPTMFDSQDWLIISKYKWHINKAGYAIGSYKENDGTWVSIKMHRLILNISDQFIFTDHINHIKSDNRRLNIRACTPLQNSRNASPRGEISKYLGVTYQRINYKSLKTGEILSYKYIKAKINYGGKLLHLGTFSSERDAAIAYNNAARKYFGEFANLNTID